MFNFVSVRDQLARQPHRSTRQLKSSVATARHCSPQGWRDLFAMEAKEVATDEGNPTEADMLRAEASY
ncbi:hypothetical protein AB0D59_49895 [Streptomyces sp. NPDC048417]|uniref:hypothetical protein n=1 Tax=Streptomyces sp. NPDC048417 TaxID=3155387 RepID=UPI00342C746C